MHLILCVFRAPLQREAPALSAAVCFFKGWVSGGDAWFTVAHTSFQCTGTWMGAGQSRARLVLLQLPLRARTPRDLRCNSSCTPGCLLGLRRPRLNAHSPPPPLYNPIRFCVFTPVYSPTASRLLKEPNWSTEEIWRVPVALCTSHVRRGEGKGTEEGMWVRVAARASCAQRTDLLVWDQCSNNKNKIEKQQVEERDAETEDAIWAEELRLVKGKSTDYFFFGLVY